MSDLETAKAALANALLNTGAEWDECCDSVESFCRRHNADENRGDLVTALYAECYRYEDM
jgi:hypothetical protein